MRMEVSYIQLLISVQTYHGRFMLQARSLLDSPHRKGYTKNVVIS